NFLIAVHRNPNFRTPEVKEFGVSRKPLPWNSPPKLGGAAVRAVFSERRGGSLREPPRLRLSKVASHHFPDGAATPPNLGGEFSTLLNFAGQVPARAGGPTEAISMPPSP